MTNTKKSMWSFKMILRTVIILGAFFGVMFLIIAITTQPKSVASIKQIESVLTEQGYTPIDTTEIWKERMSEDIKPCLTKSVSIQVDDIDFTFFAFSDDKSADGIRGYFNSYIRWNRFSVPNIEFSEGHGNYVAYTLKAGGLYSLNVRVGNTLVFATSNEESAPKIHDIMVAIGYFEE